MKNFDRCQEIYDNMCPDDEEEDCEECEPDFEQMIEDREHANDWRN